MSGQMPPSNSGPYGSYGPGSMPSQPLNGPNTPGFGPPLSRPLYAPYGPGPTPPQPPYGSYGPGSAPSQPLYAPYGPPPTTPQPPRPPQTRGIIGRFSQWWNSGCWQKALVLGFIPVILICSCCSFGIIYDLTPAGQQQLAAARATDAASTATAVSVAGTQAVKDTYATATAYTYAEQHPTPTPIPTNTPAPHWTTIHHYEGSGNFESDPVQIPEGARIAWSMTPDSDQNLNYFTADIESVTTHQTYSVASESDSTHVKSGVVGGAIDDKYYVQVSSFYIKQWTIDVQVFQ